MEISADAYEKLGVFYLGREYDLQAKAAQDKLLLYDSKDLVTHGVVLGMTGSGKTGLCLALLEEAAMDNIPAIIIDPKGDIPNIMLTFPELQGSDFRPWVNEDDARNKGLTPDDFAAKQAETWKKGLGEWGQSGERIRQLRQKVDIAIYTPGSNAGIPVSILSSFAAPSFEIADDAELLADRVENTVTSLLGLMGTEADPMQSPEHILMSQIMAHVWRKGEDVTLPKLIQQIQKPPFDSVGVVPLENFMEEKKRFDLAMRLNTLLASPGFQSWTQGLPLDVQKFFYTEQGKPRIAIFSIANLDDSQRMFFVSLLFNQMLAWMRAQSGTTSLRALLYMDEIFGFLPPVANPPSKKPLMVMLKQARAFGLGILLATQNPVDLDYKALSNIGSWFLGRLQTERDKMRVLDGLEGAAASQGGRFDRARMEEILAGLGNRIFLMNNVHEDAPVVFQVRWCMSYLRGPISRAQIKQLMDPIKKTIGKVLEEAAQTATAVAPAQEQKIIYRLPKSLEQVYLPLIIAPGDRAIAYAPGVMATATIGISEPDHGVEGQWTASYVARINEDARVLDFNKAKKLDKELKGVDEEPVEGAKIAALPDFAQDSKFYTEQKKAFTDWLALNFSIPVYHAPGLEQSSKPGEGEAEFRVRLQQAAREARDAQIGALRQKYADKIEDVKLKLDRAMRTWEKEKAQARSAKMGTLISFGSTILSAVLGGRKKVGIGTLSRGATAARGMSRAMGESGDAEAAESEVERLEDEIKELEKQLETEAEQIRDAMDATKIELETIRLKPAKKNIQVSRFALAWLPSVKVSDFEVKPAWLEDSSLG